MATIFAGTEKVSLFELGQAERLILDQKDNLISGNRPADKAQVMLESLLSLKGRIPSVWKSFELSGIRVVPEKPSLLQQVGGSKGQLIVAVLPVFIYVIPIVLKALGLQF